MWNFLKRLLKINPDEDLCTNYGHSAVSHVAKMEPTNSMEKYSYKMKRLECKRCECNQFK